MATQKVCTSSCAFGKVVDDLLVVKELFAKKSSTHQEHYENDVRMGAYSKRILIFLAVIITTSIILGGNFIRIFDDETEIVGLNDVTTDTKTGRDHLSGVRCDQCDDIPPCVDIKSQVSV